MLSFSLHNASESKDLLLPAWATSSFTTVAGQGWLAGLAEPALDAGTTLACPDSGSKAGSPVWTAMASSSSNVARKMTDLPAGRVIFLLN